MAELEETLRTIFEQRKDKTMFIAGAPSLRYGEIVDVIDAAKGAGVEKVGIVTEGMRQEAQGGGQERPSSPPGFQTNVPLTATLLAGSGRFRVRPCRSRRVTPASAVSKPLNAG